MNAGFLSYIVLTLSFILANFGWRRQAIGSATVRAFRWFCFGWIAAVAWHWHLPSGYEGTLAYVPLLALAAIGLRSAGSGRESVSALAYALLLGAVASLVQLFEALDPLMIVLHPFFDPLIVLWTLTICYTRSAPLQLAMLSVGLLLNDAYMAFMYQAWERPFFGDRSFQDAWWVSAFAVRAAAATVSGAGTWARIGTERWAGRLRPRK